MTTTTARQPSEKTWYYHLDETNGLAYWTFATVPVRAAEATAQGASVTPK